MSHTSKGFAILLAITLSFSNLIFAEFCSAQNGTNENGIISQNKTWTKADSPHNLVENVTVNSGVTLTIEPGVTVNFLGHRLQIDGTLFAKGTSENNITFNGFENKTTYKGYIVFTQTSDSWNPNGNAGCIIENCDLIKVNVEINNCSPLINDNLFQGTGGDGVNMITIFGGSAIISSNTFTKNLYPYYHGGGMSGHAAIELGDNNATIINNKIEQCSTGISFRTMETFTGKTTIERNLINNNSVGLRIGQLPIIVQNNTITQNTLGLGVFGYSNNSIFVNNNLYGNTNWNVGLEGSANANLNLTFNWWGTIDSQVINRAIYDFKNNSKLGVVNFIPFLISQNPQATPNVPADSPTPTPSLFPTPTPITPEITLAPTSNLPASSPTVAPVFTPTPEPTSTSPTIPRIIIEPTVIVVVAVVVAFAVIALTLSRRHQNRQLLKAYS